MEWTVAESGVSDREIVVGPIRYAVAGRADEKELRQLLRGNATDGWMIHTFAAEHATTSKRDAAKPNALRMTASYVDANPPASAISRSVLTASQG